MKVDKNICQIYVLFRLSEKLENGNGKWIEKSKEFYKDFLELKNNSLYRFIPIDFFENNEFVQNSIRILKTDL